MDVRIIVGDVLTKLCAMPAKSVHSVVTSPPYFGLRDYGIAGQIGQEATPAAYVAVMVKVFHEVHRVLRDDGTLWLNLGDSYCSVGGELGKPDNDRKWREGSARADGEVRLDKVSRRNRNGTTAPGLKPKDLIGIPWRVALALQDAGWYLRQDIIWSKPNPMPESVTDRCTKAHEYLFLFSKEPNYYFNSLAIQERATYPEGPGNNKDNKYTAEYEKGSDQRLRTKAGLHKIGARDTRNKRSVWTVNTQPYADAHFATFPPALIKPCIEAGVPLDCCSKCGASTCSHKAKTTPGRVLDIFGGSGTTAFVARGLGRSSTLIELNPKYAEMARRRLVKKFGFFVKVTVE